MTDIERHLSALEHLVTDLLSRQEKRPSGAAFPAPDCKDILQRAGAMWDARQSGGKG